MSADGSWVSQLEGEWARLARNDMTLNVERFYRHVLQANKAGFVPPETLASTANALVFSPIPGAAYLGRKLLEQTGVAAHPALRVVYALSLFRETCGAVDFELANSHMNDVLKDEAASDKLKGLAAASLADSARLGRGGEVDFELAKAKYMLAVEHGFKDAAFNLGLYWEGGWGGSAPGDIVPDRTQAIQWHARAGAHNVKSAARIKTLKEDTSV